MEADSKHPFIVPMSGSSVTEEQAARNAEDTIPNLRSQVRSLRTYKRRLNKKIRAEKKLRENLVTLKRETRALSDQLRALQEESRHYPWSK